MNLILSTLLAIISGSAYSIIANVPRRALKGTAITSGLSWLVYYLLNQLNIGIGVPNFFAAFCIGVIGNYLSRKIKVPLTMIMVGSLISLVPGGLAFSSIQNFYNAIGFANGMVNTMISALSLAIGMGVSTSLNSLIYSQKSEKGYLKK